jgi:aminopeptidase N
MRLHAWILGGSLVACAFTSAAAQVSAPPRSEPRAVRAARADAPDRYGTGADVLRYDIELALPEKASWFIGHARVRVLRKAPLRQELTLDFTGLAVDAVHVNGRAVRFRHEADRLAIAVADADGDTLDVDVRYRGVPDEGLFIAPDAHGSRAAFADNWPNRARFWFPAVDHPGDKALVSFTVHAPTD